MISRERHHQNSTALTFVSFFAMFNYFVLDLATLVTQYIYFFTLSFFPFIALIIPFLYPKCRNVLSEKQLLIIIDSCISSLLIFRFVTGIIGIIPFAGNLTYHIVNISFFVAMIFVSCVFIEFMNESNHCNQIPDSVIAHAFLKDQFFLLGFLFVISFHLSFSHLSSDVLRFCTGLFLLTITIAIMFKDKRSSHSRNQANMPNNDVNSNHQTAPKSILFKTQKIMKMLYFSSVISFFTYFIAVWIDPINPFPEFDGDASDWRNLLVIILIIPELISLHSISKVKRITSNPKNKMNLLLL
ncbi:MAG: hypothetical protein ACTSWN_01275, partial [Promethearchaeota archaeon]